MCAWLEFISFVGSFTQFNGCTTYTYILLPQYFGELNIRNHNLFMYLNYRFYFLDVSTSYFVDSY